MSRLALHLIWGCYGFWLPNDPRGSWSVYVGSRPIYDIAGRATRVQTRRSLAGDAHDPHLRRAAKAALAEPPIRLTGPQAREVALGIGQACAEIGRAAYALSVMPDHVHVVVDNAEKDAKQTIGRLKSFATKRLNAAGLSPRGDQTPWVRGGWFVSLQDGEQVVRAIRYVNDNPVRAGLRVQRWSFIQPWSEK